VWRCLLACVRDVGCHWTGLGVTCYVVSGLFTVTGLGGENLLVSVTGLEGEASAHLGLCSVIEDHSRYRTELRPENDVFSETLCSF